jgi:hypothetical protein
MASLNSKAGSDHVGAWQSWIIEDSWRGMVSLQARLIKSWQGLCGSYRVLEDVEGHCYLWLVVPAQPGGAVRQRLVCFADADSLEAELDSLAWPAWTPAAASTTCH